MPELAHWFGLHPWDVDRLTVNQTNRYMAWVNKQRPKK